MAYFRENPVSLTTSWQLLKTIPAGNGGIVDFDVANLSGAVRNVRLAARNSATLPTDDTYTIRGPIAIGDGEDWNPHHVIVPGGWSVFGIADGTNVNAAVSGEDGT